MKTSNKILSGFFGLVLLLLFLFLIFIRFNLSPKGWGEGDQLIEGNGTIKTEKYTVSDYNDIRLGQNFEVELQPGAEFLELSIDENLLQYIQPTVRNGQLHIDIDKSVSLKPSGRVKMKIGIQQLEKLYSSGSSRVSATDTLKTSQLEVGTSGSGAVHLLIQSEEIDATVSGSGDMQLRGNSQDLKVTIAGSGRVNATELMSKTVDARISGSGDASVHAIEYLNVGIAGSGHLSYKGDPQIRQQISGSGRLSKQD